MRPLRAIKYYWQRNTRGWDDSEVWDLDNTFCKWIVPRLKRLKKIQHGFPDAVGLEGWNQILDEMVEGFTIEARRYKIEDLTIRRRENRARVQKAYELLARFHANLWD